MKWGGQNSTFCHEILRLNSKILGPFAAADPRRQRVEMVYRFDIHNLRLNLRPSAKSVHAFSPAARTVSEKLQSGVGTLPTVCMVHNAHSRQRDNLYLHFYFCFYLYYILISFSFCFIPFHLISFICIPLHLIVILI